MVTWRFLFISLLMGGLALTSKAQQYQLNTLNIYEGFSKGLVKDIVVDDIGLVWLATDEGLIRFDGQDASFFKDELTGGFAKALLRKKNGNLLVAYDLGITEIRSEADTVYFTPLIEGRLENTDSTLFYPKSLHETSDSQLWIGENNALALFSNNGLKKYYFPDKDKSDNIFRNFSFLEDEDKRLWVLSFPGYLHYFDPQQDRFVEMPLGCTIRQASALIQVAAHTFWATAQNGIFEIALDDQANLLYCRQVPGLDNISCGIVVNQKYLYVGTWDKGLYYLHLDRREKAWEKVNLLPFEQIIALRYDPNNGLWVAGNDNIALLTPSFFKSYQFNLSEIPVEAIELRADSSLLLSSGSQLLRLYPNGEEWLVKEPLTLDNVVPTALNLHQDSLWIGTLSGQLQYYKDLENQGTTVALVPPSSNSITNIHFDQKGDLWAAGNETTGLIRRTPDGQYSFYKDAGLKNSRVIFESPSGTLFVGGGYAGSYLFLYDRQKDKFWDISVDFPFLVSKNFTVEDIALQRNDDLLLATSDGLLQFSLSARKTEIQKVSRIDLLKVPINDPVKAIALAQDGTCWISTPSGLVAYNGSASLLFDKNSGLPSNNLTYRGLQIDYRQNLWVATSKGIGLFQKNSINNNATPQPLIKNIRVNKSKIPYDSSFTLKIPFHAALEINFQCFSYPVNKLKYQTRILELDQDWSESQSVSYTLLSGLKAGTYTFQVRAQQKGGYSWSLPQTVNFSISKPWYQNLWAVLPLLLLLVGLLYTIARVYNWTLIQQNEKLEKNIQERIAEIKQQQQEIIEQKNQIIEQNEQFRILKEEQLQQQIEYQNKQLTTYTLHLLQKNEALRELQQKIFTSIRSLDKGKTSQADLKSFLSLIDYSFHKDREWENFKLYFEEVHSGFFETLKNNYPDLSLLELRHCALIRLNLSIPETATILGISTESVKTARFRIRKKMEVSSQQEVVEAVMKI